MNGAVTALKAMPLRGRPRPSLDRGHHPAQEGLYGGKGRSGPPNPTIQSPATAIPRPAG